MKRRKILGALVSCGIPGISNATHYFGAPGSITGPVTSPSAAPMRLSIDTAKISSLSLAELSTFGTVWDKVLSDRDERKKFQHDPASYLESKGVPGSTLTAHDHEVKILVAISNEDVLSSCLTSIRFSGDVN